MVRTWLTIILLTISTYAGSSNSTGTNLRPERAIGIGLDVLDVSGREGIQRRIQEDYKQRMSALESSHSLTVVNRYGYMGRYQFGKSTLRGLVKSGYLEAEVLKGFLGNAEKQEKAMDALIQHNLDYFKRNDMMKYVGKRIGGVTITVNGLLAGAHLVGPYAVKRFLKTGGRVIKKDGNGTTVKDYLKEFEDGKRIKHF